jgi:predicted DNA-binding antitoxin AbrB/MazE fold protein
MTHVIYDESIRRVEPAMTQVDAIYEGGVLRHLGLQENQRVRLEIRPIEEINGLDWLAGVQKRQAEIVSSQGYFPDSIAEDRLRDA